MSRQHLVLAVTLISSLFLRLIYVMLFDAEITPYADPWYFIRTAEGILDGLGYRVGHLLAYQPPLYTYFIAAVFGVIGKSVSAVCFIQAFLSMIMCYAVFLISKKTISARAGLIAAGLCAVYPALIHTSGQLWSETLFMFFLYIAIFCFFVSEKQSSIAWRIATGVFLGLAALTREAGIFVLIAFLIYLILNYRSLTISLKRFWIIALFMVLVISPWTIRNHLVFKKFVPIATNGGINFYMGNNPEATGTFRWALPPGTTWNQESPNGFFETEANRLGYEHGIRFITENLGQSVVLTAKKAFYLWQPPYWVIDMNESKPEIASKVVWLIMHVVLFVFSFVIGPFYLRGNLRIPYFFWATAIMITLPSLVTVGINRYHFPAIPSMALITAIVLDRMLTLKENRRLSYPQERE